MSYKIQKSLVRKAWKELSERNLSGADPRLNRLLTAAALAALVENEDRIEWFQPPPPHTVLKVVEGTVLLGFDPEAEFSIVPAPPPHIVAKASQELDSHGNVRTRLQLLALNALSGNIDWTEEPPFNQS
ncbi:MAG TPA: hypothetical protein VKZ59_06325 [Acidobacteriota bacterium]|nr:hypothetical protein [Acidobacteriota bacterium]